MYRFLEVLTPEQIGAITAQAQVEMLESGFAAVAEFHYLHHAPRGAAYENPAETSERVMEAARDTGIGLTLLPVVYAAADSGGRAPEGGQLRFACDTDRYEHLWQAAAGALAGGPADWRIGIAPHSLRAVPRAELETVLAAHPDGPVHIHVAEQTAEVEEIQTAYGARPVAWLLDRHGVDARWCLVHATHVDADECDALAASGAVAGLCPITEADLGDGLFPAERYLGAGGLLGVGTDSNVRVTLAGELSLLEYGQRLDRRRRNVLATRETSTGRTLFEAALAGGARALGRDAGRIESGRLADLLTLDTSELDLHGLDGDALLDGFVFSASRSVVGEVWSAGREQVRGGRHVSADAVAARYRQAIDSLVS